MVSLGNNVNLENLTHAETSHCRGQNCFICPKRSFCVESIFRIHSLFMSTTCNEVTLFISCLQSLYSVLCEPVMVAGTVILEHVAVRDVTGVQPQVITLNCTKRTTPISSTNSKEYLRFLCQ